MFEQIIIIAIGFLFYVSSSYGQVNFSTLNSSTYNNCAVWDICPNPNIVNTDTVFIKHDIVSSANITVDGVLYISSTGFYSGNHKITIGVNGKLYNYGRIEITEELHNDGEVYNNNYLGVKKYHDDGYTCNVDTIEIEQGQKYDCHGCTLECGGTLLACDIKLHDSGATSALISEVDVCCQDGNEPSVELQSGSIDSSSVDFCSFLLPVDLLYFSAKYQENSVIMDWESATEVNNKEFGVWRSLTGIEFNFIGRVSGAGTMSTPNQYTFVDDNPLEGISYYRLSQVDFDGKEKFYPIEIVSNEMFDLLNCYPNPVEDELTIEFSSSILTPVKVEICNVVGQVLHQYQFKIEMGENKLKIPTNSIRNGIYFFRLSMPNGEFILKKFLKH